MATLQIVTAYHTRSDNKHQVRIRLTHNRKSVFINTGYYVEGDKVDSQSLSIELKQRIVDYEKKILTLSTSAKTMTAVEIKTFLEKPDDLQEVNLIPYFKSKIDNFKLTKAKQTVKGYNTALDRLKAFLGTDTLLSSKFTVTLLNSFEINLRTVPGKQKKTVGNTTIRLFMTYISTLASIAETEDVLLKNPFRKGYKKPQANIPDKRTLEIATLRKLFNDNPVDAREIFAQEIFKLSFCLAGMNTADMFCCLKNNTNRIQYNRQKTKRRKDKAFMSLPVSSEIKELVEKYSDPVRQFNFYKLYTNPGQFNKRVNFGLNLICTRLEIPVITTYHARHSFGSYARNECNIAIDEVDLALVHKDNYAMTSKYTKVDWTKVDRAVRAVLDYVYETKGGMKVVKMAN
jgi:hypothetical protein